MSENKNNEETLIVHIQELRKTLIRSLTALAVGFIPAFILSPNVLDKLIKILTADVSVVLNFFSPMEIFILQLKLAVIIDLLICFPYIAGQIWNFILPGLYENERKFIKSIVLTSSILFITGTLFCLFFILPLIIKFGLGFATANIKAVLGISNIVSLSLKLSVIFGIMFQFPLITYSLIRSEIITYNAIKDKRPYIFTFILIMAAFLTPPDIISQILLTLPTYILFETGLYFAKK